MPLDAQSDVPAPPRGFTLDTASPSLPPAQTDDGIPTVTVRPQGAKKPNAGNEGGEPTPPAGFKLDSQPHVEGATPSSQSHGAVSGFSVLAPPPDKAPIVEEAAKRYGVPLNVAHFVGSTESHWNDAATGIPTSSGRASGAWQFMPETAKQYGLANPNDFPTATAAAMHKLADLAANNGGDWEKAVAQYGTFSTGQGADKDAAVRQSFRDYMGDKTPIAQDVAQGTGRGLIQGSGYVLGMPADLWHMMDRGYQWALTKGAEKLGLMSPEEGEELRQPVGGEDAETSPLSSENINKHLLRLAQMGGANISAPVTTPGQAAETVSSFLPGAAALGASTLRQAPMAAVKYGLIPGATSEAAGEATQGTPLEPYARISGAMTPMALGVGYSAASRAMNPLNRTMQGLTAEQSQAAQTLLDQSRAAGAPLTVPEAVQQVTGSGTRLGDMQRVVEQSPQGGAVMRPFFAQRPGQTETLARNTLDQIAGVPPDPYQVAPRVQGAANQTMQDAATARTQAVDPHYQAAATDRVPVEDMQDYLSRIDAMTAGDKTGIMGPELSQLRSRLVETPAQPGTPAQRIPTQTPTGATIYRSVPATPPTPEVPITDIENLDRVRKFFRDRLSLPQWAQNATSKEEGAKVGSLLDDLRQRMIAASPEFAQGKQLYQDITENSFKPLTQSPTGQLAKAEKFPQQSEILFDTNPVPGSEKAIGKAIRQVAQRDPEAAAQLVRMHLEQVFNEATQKNMSGPNQFGGGKFAAVVSGNTQQAKNLEAAVRALPDGDVRWNAVRKSMDIMEAMGKRQSVGSQTEFNRQINQALHSGHPLPEIVTTAGSPGRWLSVVKDVYRDFVYGRNTANLARVFTEGDVADLRALAQSGSQSVAGQARLVGAIQNPGPPASGWRNLWLDPATNPATGAARAAAGPFAPAYGANNRLFTQADAADARATLRAKSGQINTGLDPEALAAMVRLAGFHIESGARSFGQFSTRMIQDMGESARPYLQQVYDQAKTLMGDQSGPRRSKLAISQEPIGADRLEHNLSVNGILDPAFPSLAARSRGVEDIAQQLMTRGGSALKALGVKEGKITGPAPLTDELLSRTIASEIKGALQRGGNTAADWYTGKIRQAMGAVSTIHPEVATEPNARMGFTSSLAITSQGETVPSNVRLADQAYNYFKENGRFPTNVVAKNGPAMNANFRKLNDLIDAHGLDATREFLSRDFTVKDLKGMGYDIGGENVGTQVKGSAILGPKIGGGFYQNLNGNFDPVTMDLWFMRGWGRLTGTLVGMAPEALAKQRSRLEAALEANGQKAPKTTPALMKAAEDVIKTHGRDYATNRAAYDSGEKAKSELTYAAERFQKGQAGINEQPGSGSARTWMRSVVGRSRQLLANEGTDVTPADLQAIWWYPEKDLYGKLGGRDSEGINVDYASAISNLARSKGVSDAELARAMGSVDH